VERASGGIARIIVTVHGTSHTASRATCGVERPATTEAGRCDRLGEVGGDPNGGLCAGKIPEETLTTPLSIVYVLTNPAMPGLVKIGRTDAEDASDRLAQLYSTGVPFPFTLEFACRVPNPDEVEQALHEAFSPYRVNPRREFFKIEAPQAIAILRLLHVEDATHEVEHQPEGVDAVEVEAARQYRNRRPNLNFQEMQIPIDSVLTLTKNNATVVVTGPKKVRVNHEEMSLSAATKSLLGLDYNVAPGPYWSFQGKPLQDIYNETYLEEA
jgi:hypothetical protein